MMLKPQNDLNRTGLFSELGYISVGDPYTKKNGSSFNISSHKGKQMLPGGTKSRTSTQAGYFDKNFNRIMQGEGYNDPVKRRRQDRLEKTKLNLGKAFTPSHTGKEPSGIGSHYGTFSGPVPTFSPAEKTKNPYAAPGKNFTTNPSKKGTGYGYVNVIIGKPPTHASEPYDAGKQMMKRSHERSKEMMKGASFKLNLHPKDFFDSNPYKTEKPMPPYEETKKEASTLKPFKHSSPGKEIGGCKSGCFTNYPSHSDEPYNSQKRNFREKSKETGIFRPSQGPKSMPMHSIMAKNVDRRINQRNFKEASLTTVSVL